MSRRPGTGRRGPEHLWARFDAAVDQLNEAGAGESLADVVAAYAAVSEAAGAVADALEAAGECAPNARALLRAVCSPRLGTRSVVGPPGGVLG